MYLKRGKIILYKIINIYIYLTAKETHIFNFHFIPETLVQIFTLNDMNMFERTHAFVPDHFIRHYTVNYYFLLIYVNNAKAVPYIGKHMI